MYRSDPIRPSRFQAQPTIRHIDERDLFPGNLAGPRSGTRPLQAVATMNAAIHQQVVSDPEDDTTKEASRAHLRDPFFV